MSFSNLLNQSISIYRKAGYDKFGKPTDASPTTVNARFQKTTKQRLLPNSSLVTIAAIVYVPSGTSVEANDKVVYGGVDYKVFGKYEAVDDTGSTHHIKLELTKWQT